MTTTLDQPVAHRGLLDSLPPPIDHFAHPGTALVSRRVERRQWPRCRVDAPIRFDLLTNGGTRLGNGCGSMRNLSLHGACFDKLELLEIEMDAARVMLFSRGSVVFHFEVTEGGLRGVRGRARAVRVDELFRGIGVRFLGGFTLPVLA